MITVHKFPFRIEHEFTLEMPWGAKILKVAYQDGVPCVWAQVNTENMPDGRKFRVFGTGHEITENKQLVQIDIDIECFEESLKDFPEGSLDHRRMENQIKLKELERSNKLHSLNKIKLTAMSRYNEAKNWKGCVEDIMGEMGVKSLDEVNFNQIRMDEMEGKLKKWGELQANEMLEMTPSRLQVIYDNQEAFQKGFFKGKLNIDHQQLTHQIPQLEAQASDLMHGPQNEETAATLAKLRKDIADMKAHLAQVEAAKAALEVEETQRKLLK